MNTARERIFYGTVFCLFLSLMACQSTSSSLQGVVGFHGKEVQFIDPDLSQWVSVSDIQTWKERDVLNIQIKLINQTNQRQYLEYQFYLYTSEGRQVESPFAYWRPIILEAKETQAVTANALVQDVKNFTMALRKAQPLQAQ